jgi:hypothetical protein
MSHLATARPPDFFCIGIGINPRHPDTDPNPDTEPDPDPENQSLSGDVCFQGLAQGVSLETEHLPCRRCFAPGRARGWVCLRLPRADTTFKGRLAVHGEEASCIPGQALPRGAVFVSLTV